MLSFVWGQSSSDPSVPDPIRLRKGAHLRVPGVRTPPLTPARPIARQARALDPPCLMPRVMTVDDQEVFRSAARAVVEATPGFESAGEPASGEEALRLVNEARPELVLVDVRMPGLGGVETARALSARDPELVVVLVSLDDTPAEAAPEAIPFARKQDFGPRLLRALWAAHGSRRP